MSQQDLPPPVLAPCPFCGRMMQQHDKYSTEYRHAYARNDRCPAGATVIYIDDAPAVAAWNRRPSPKAEMQGEEMASARVQLQSAMRMAERDRSDLVSVPLSVGELRALLSAPKDASRDDVLEEAAKVADEFGPLHSSRHNEAIADAIRALKEKPHG